MLRSFQIKLLDTIRAAGGELGDMSKCGAAGGELDDMLVVGTANHANCVYHADFPNYYFLLDQRHLHAQLYITKASEFTRINISVGVTILHT